MTDEARETESSEAPTEEARRHAREIHRAVLAELTRQRAYEIYQHRLAHGLAGDARSDWLKAEAELLRPEE